MSVFLYFVIVYILNILYLFNI